MRSPGIFKVFYMTFKYSHPSENINYNASFMCFVIRHVIESNKKKYWVIGLVRASEVIRSE